jgi:hypothetical protein
MSVISKVTYSKLFPTSSYLNDRVGIEIDLVAGDNAMDALNEAKELAETFHRQAYPELYLKEVKNLTTDEVSTIDEIKACTDLKKLGVFKEKANNPNIRPHYMTKLKTLTDNHSTK